MAKFITDPFDNISYDYENNERASSKKIFSTRPITREGTPFARSAVNIIVPYHGRLEHVTRLVESILRVTQSNPYQICLVDDASPNSNEEAIEFGKVMTKLIPPMHDAIPQIVWVRNEKQLGFAGALRKGFEYTAQQKVVAPWVLFLHSDCKIVDPGWMIEMGRSLLNGRSKNIKMVSARSNNPGNGLNPALGGERDSFERRGDDIILESDEFIPLYCAMCHRELFDHIGGFIKQYPYGMYEDEELGFRMKKHGFKQAVSVKSWVEHEGGVTFNPLCLNPKIKRIVESNRERCIFDMRSLL